MYASIWFMSGVAIHLFLLTKMVSSSTSQVFLFLNSNNLKLIFSMVFLFSLS